MAVARKSAVSIKSNWLKQNTTSSLGKKRSANLGSRVQSSSTLPVASVSATSKRRRHSSQNLSVAPHNAAVMPTTKKVKESGKQQLSILNKQPNVHVPVMPSSGAAPVWLLRLYTFNRYSSILAFLFVAAALVVYGWTVYSQETWSQSYQRLRNLQRYERQLTTTNATLTHKMAEEAEQPTAGLKSPTPEGTIFLPPAPYKPNSGSSTTKPNLEVHEQDLPPLGY